MDMGYSVLFVCMGNICRSPTADGVFRKKVGNLGWQTQVHVDSAGTHNYHPGSPPDARSQEAAARRGYDLSQLRARQIAAPDYASFDLILSMDENNLELLKDDCPDEYQHKLHRLTDFCTEFHVSQVPDPYYGGEAGFEIVLDLVEDACDRLLEHVQRHVNANRAA
jgi:protein-tyrosine phosphatase